MKKIVSLILLVSLICLTGCSNTSPDQPITVKWENGVTSINNKAVTFTEYGGYYASIEGGLGGYIFRLNLDTAKDVTTLTENTQGILEENMYKYKDMFYYTEFLGTQFTMAKNLGNDNWSVLKCITDRSDDPALVATYGAEYINNIPLTNNQVYVDFGDFKLGNDYDAVIVRQDCALITGVIKVSQGSKGCSEPYTLIQEDKQYQLMKLSGEKYDYYEYGGYLIQIAAGLQIENYITFK